jgi:hypothetical protein
MKPIQLEPTFHEYRITVSALGYEDTVKTVVAQGATEARKHQRQAVTEWLAHNAIGNDCRGFASTHLSRVR